MTKYCEVCGEELDPEDEEAGICENCKIARSQEHGYEGDKNDYDPAIT